MKPISWRMAFIALGMFLAAFPAPYTAHTRSWQQDPTVSPLNLVTGALLAAMCGAGLLWYMRRHRTRAS